MQKKARRLAAVLKTCAARMILDCGVSLPLHVPYHLQVMIMCKDPVNTGPSYMVNTSTVSTHNEFSV